MKIINYKHNINTLPCKLNRCKMHFSEITIVLNGQLQYVINRKKYVINANDIIYIPYGSLRERELNTRSIADYVSFNFIEEINEDTTNLYRNSVNDIIKNLVATCDSVRESTSSYDDERLLLLLKCLLSQLQHQNKNINVNPLVIKIKKYIRTNLDKKITLTDISNATFFSPVHCEKVFKKTTNSSIIDYVISQKINEAQSLIMTEPADIKYIAEKVGFDNPNYFSRLFKRRTGYTPSQYKKKNLK